MSWFNRTPKCEHSWEVLRCADFFIKHGAVGTTGPWTRVSWRCRKCRAKRASDKKGYWKIEDFKS